MNIARMPILEHNHDAAANNSNKTAMLINHCIKQCRVVFVGIGFFILMIAKLGIFGAQLTKTILCLNRKEAWGKKTKESWIHCA